MLLPTPLMPTSLQPTSLQHEQALPMSPNRPDPGPAPLGHIGHIGHIGPATTRTVPAIRQRLQRTHGVMGEDRSALSEAFKRLRSQLLQRLRVDGHSVVAVTSPRAVAGKSLTALNLALALAAEPDRTVLLVDADLSGQGLQTLLGLEAEPGLGEHLSQGTPIGQLLLNPGLPRLVLLPAGSTGVQGAAEWLGARATGQLAHEFKHRYANRVVIVDLPPLLDSADALSFMPWVDTTLLVVEEHGTTLADLESANELLAPYALVGAVLTRPHPPSRAQPAPRAAGWWRRLFRKP